MDQPPPSDYIHTTSLEDSVVHVTSTRHLDELLPEASEYEHNIVLLHTDIQKRVLHLFEGENGLYFTVEVQRENNGTIISDTCSSVHSRIQEILTAHDNDEHTILGKLCNLPIVISIIEAPELVINANTIKQPVVIKPGIGVQIQNFWKKLTGVFIPDVNTKFVQ